MIVFSVYVLRVTDSIYSLMLHIYKLILQKKHNYIFVIINGRRLSKLEKVKTLL